MTTSIVLQVLLAIGMANEKISFVHNDLHTKNVIVEKTDLPRIEYHYNGKNYSIPTYGCIGRIFDFQFSTVVVNDDLIGCQQGSMIASLKDWEIDPMNTDPIYDGYTLCRSVSLDRHKPLYSEYFGSLIDSHIERAPMSALSGFTLSGVIDELIKSVG